jgi:hypothetical protein
MLFALSLRCRCNTELGAGFELLVLQSVWGGVVRWCGGAVVRWCGGAVVRWCGGALVGQVHSSHGKQYREHTWLLP